VFFGGSAVLLPVPHSFEEGIEGKKVNSYSALRTHFFGAQSSRGFPDRHPFLTGVWFWGVGGRKLI